MYLKYKLHGFINDGHYLTRCKFISLCADSETTLHKAYVYQTGIMQAHCVLSTADSLSYCVNRPSCVRPAALQCNSKAHIAPRTCYTQHRVTPHCRQRSQCFNFQLVIFFFFWSWVRNILGLCGGCSTSAPGSAQQRRTNHSSPTHTHAHTQAGRHGNTHFIPQRSVCVAERRLDKSRSAPRAPKGSWVKRCDVM